MSKNSPNQRIEQIKLWLTRQKTEIKVLFTKKD